MKPREESTSFSFQGSFGLLLDTTLRCGRTTGKDPLPRAEPSPGAGGAVHTLVLVPVEGQNGRCHRTSSPLQAAGSAPASRVFPHGFIRRRGVIMRRLITFASTPFRVVVFITAIWLAVGWLTGVLRPLDAFLGVELPAWVQIPGLVAGVAGGALVLVCGTMLSTRGIGTLGGEEWFMPREFVATGPFRFVRNPMSLGGTVLMTGIALCHRSAIGLGLAAALFLVFHLVVVYLEEPG